MKFQSLIAPIMHGSRFPTRAAVILLTIPGLGGCVGVVAKKNSYGVTSAPVTVNGAKVRMEVKPEGSSGGSYALSAVVVSAGVTTFDGPFRWRVQASGDISRHESLIIHRIRTRTEKTRRDEWYPASGLGRRADFKRPLGTQGPVVATYEIPGRLEVKPFEDGPLEIQVDLSVKGGGRTERKTVIFRMSPSSNRQNEFIFIPSEVISSIRGASESMKESGWD